MKNFAKKIAALLLVAVIAVGACSSAFALVMGDVDSDGKCTAADARLILRVAVNLETFNDAQHKLADFDKDNKITSADARLALRKAVGLYTDNDTPSPSIPEGNEYDILASGTFYFVGTMIESDGVKSPTSLALTKNSTYMESSFNGVSISILVLDGKIYMIYPEKKAYMNLDSKTMTILGMSSDDFKLETDFAPLSKASNSYTENVGGVNCSVFTFNYTDGSSSKVYLNGKKLVKLSQFDANKKLIAETQFSSVSATVPNDKKSIPTGYKKVSLVAFMSYFL